MWMPQWLRYMLLVIITAGLTTFLVKKGADQFLALIWGKHIAMESRAVAAAQQYMAEGKNEKASALLCELAMAQNQRLAELTKIVDEGLFPNAAIERAGGEDLKYINTTKGRLTEVAQRCRTQTVANH